MEHGFLYNGSGYTTLDPPGADPQHTPMASRAATSLGPMWTLRERRRLFRTNGFEYKTLDPHGSQSSLASGVSGKNVVGIHEDASRVWGGFLYNGSGYTILSGGRETSANGGSGNNVVGQYLDYYGVYHGFLHAVP